MTVIDNYRLIEKKIRQITSARENQITIISVSKTFSAAVIQEAIDSGIRIFGENKVQEAQKKIPALTGTFSFHMIGHLQSNKARDAVALFDVIHSIDKAETASKVDEEAKKIDKVQSILVQVNVSGEETKSGVGPDESYALVEHILKLENISLLGLMTMAPYTENRGIIRETFRKTRELRDSISSRLGIGLTELSMGMSSDYDIAVQEGATMVRIGSAIFGERTYS